jgi:hypothetical protein
MSTLKIITECGFYLQVDRDNGTELLQVDPLKCPLSEAGGGSASHSAVAVEGVLVTKNGKKYKKLCVTSEMKQNGGGIPRHVASRPHHTRLVHF